MPHGVKSVLATVTSVAAVIAGSALVAGPALADPAGCASIDSARDARATHCIAKLRLRAEAAGRVAEEADEHYLQAKQRTAAAQHRLEALDGLAEQAEGVAARSKARAAVAVAQLTRGAGSFGPTTEILLSGDHAPTVLYRLSRMTELSSDTAQLTTDLERDVTAARLLRDEAGRAAARYARTQAAVKATYAEAETAARAAVTLVAQAEIKAGGERSALSAAYVDLPADASTADRVVAFARSKIGDPYVFGAAGPSTWDCSGLTMAAFASAGIDIGGHGATVQYTTAAERGLLVPYAQAEPGDLVFYGGDGDMAHVAIYSGGGNMIEAPQPGLSVREVPVRPDGLAPLVARFTG